MADEIQIVNIKKKIKRLQNEYNNVDKSWTPAHIECHRKVMQALIDEEERKLKNC